MPSKTESTKSQTKPSATTVNKKVVTKKPVAPVENEQSVKKMVSKKNVKTSEVVSSTPPSSPSVSTTQVDNLEAQSVSEQLTTFLASVNTLVTQLKQLQVQGKNLQRLHAKEVKTLMKVGKKGKKQQNGDKPKRAPSGFAKPTGLSQALCQFLGVSNDTQLARTEVTKKVTSYVKEHGLQNPQKKTEIVPDAKLGGLLNVPNGEKLTYFNLQKYMKVHFNKVASAVTSAVTA